MKRIEPIVAEFKAGLRELYGDQFAELILFGSYARQLSEYSSLSNFVKVVIMTWKQTCQKKE